jgi:hypothetical protein
MSEDLALPAGLDALFKTRSKKIPSDGGVDAAGGQGGSHFGESFPCLKPTPGLRQSPPLEGNHIHSHCCLHFTPV